MAEISRSSTFTRPKKSPLKGLASDNSSIMSQSASQPSTSSSPESSPGGSAPGGQKSRSTRKTSPAKVPMHKSQPNLSVSTASSRTSRDRTSSASDRMTLKAKQHASNCALAKKDREERLKKIKERQQKEQERKEAALREAEEKEVRRRETMEKERQERVRKLKEREELRQKAVHDKRKQLEEAKTLQKEAYMAKYRAQSENRASEKERNKQLYAFGSSTPRVLAYLQNLNKDQRVYDKKLISQPLSKEELEALPDTSFSSVSAARSFSMAPHPTTRTRKTPGESGNGTSNESTPQRRQKSSSISVGPQSRVRNSPGNTNSIMTRSMHVERRANRHTPSNNPSDAMTRSVYTERSRPVVRNSPRRQTPVEAVKEQNVMTTSFSVGDGDNRLPNPRRKPISRPTNNGTPGYMQPRGGNKGSEQNISTPTDKATPKTSTPNRSELMKKERKPGPPNTAQTRKKPMTNRASSNKNLIQGSPENSIKPPPVPRRQAGQGHIGEREKSPVPVSSNPTKPSPPGTPPDEKRRKNSESPKEEKEGERMEGGSSQSASPTERMETNRRGSSATSEGSEQMLIVETTEILPQTESGMEKRSDEVPPPTINNLLLDMGDDLSPPLDPKPVEPHPSEPFLLDINPPKTETVPDLLSSENETFSPVSEPVSEPEPNKTEPQTEQVLLDFDEPTPPTRVISEEKEKKVTEQSEEAAKAALMEHRRIQREIIEKEQERLRLIEEEQRRREEEEKQREEEEFRRQEEEELRLAEEMRKAEEERLQKAIEEEERRKEEERKRWEEEEQKREEEERKQMEEREKLQKEQKEREEKFRKEQEEREERKKKLNSIMARTRNAQQPSPTPPPSTLPPPATTPAITANSPGEPVSGGLHGTPSTPSLSVGSTSVLQKLAGSSPALGQILSRHKSNPSLAEPQQSSTPCNNNNKTCVDPDNRLDNTMDGDRNSKMSVSLFDTPISGANTPGDVSSRTLYDLDGGAFEEESMSKSTIMLNTTTVHSQERIEPPGVILGHDNVGNSIWKELRDVESQGMNGHFHHQPPTPTT